MIKQTHCPHCGDRMSSGHFCPSPQEIAAGCERIQANWTKTQELAARLRHNGSLADFPRVDTWTPPEMTIELERKTK